MIGALIRPVRWLAKREAALFRNAPRLRLHVGGHGQRAAGDQVLRAFVQINVLPRPR